MLRRVVHETAIQRWDAQAAVGEPGRVDSALAGEGIDEVFEIWIPLRFDDAAFNGAGRPSIPIGVDVDGEWLVTVNADSTQLRHVHEGADIAAAD